MAPTRWGIASAGNVCHDFTNALSMQPENHKVVAVAARALSRAEKFAKEFNIPKAYDSYQKLANDPEIDIVYIGTINPFHFEVSKMMMDAGKNVLCETPVTMSLKQTKDIVAVAKERNVFFMEGYWSRFFPIYTDLQKEMDNKCIGDIKFVNANFGCPLGGGGLSALGGYPIMIALKVFGELPSKISASATFDNAGEDVAGCVTLYFSGNRMAQLNYSTEVWLDQKVNIYGSKGIIEIPSFGNPLTMITPNKKFEYDLPNAQRPMNYPRGEGFIYEANAVRESLLKGDKENPVMTHEDSIKIMTVVDEIHRQIAVVHDVDPE